VSSTALEMYSASRGSNLRTVSSMLTRWNVDGTPSRLITSPARTEVPPWVARCGNRSAKVSSAAADATKCSPPPPRARYRSIDTTSSRSPVTGPDSASSAAPMPYSMTSCSRTPAVSVNS
jgi:hypothetical protein